MRTPATRQTYVFRLITAMALAACCLAGGTALAAGTPAGTIITNTVSVSFVQGGVTQTTTAGNSFMVDRAINEVVTKNSDASTAPTSTNVALSFLVSNTSNTSMRFALSEVSKPTNTWTMNNVRIYRDNNNSGAWDAGDTLYADAGTFGDVASGVSVTVLIVADAPASLTIGQTALYDLVATAVDAGTLNISIQTMGPNTAGIDTVFLDVAGSAVGDGARDGKHSASGAFSATSSAVNVNLTKTVTTLDQWGGNLPIPGAILRYVIVATTMGSGTANNVVISDPLPLNTTYIANTLKLNGAAVTDIVDADAGDVGGTTPSAVSVKLGNLTSVSPAQTIQFDVRIQ
jgi:uncharacterized repeat protein (TIGR01451 family)